jgi:2,3-bisphosphoglycerate-dependent phosphoglycerate mutase
MSMLVVMRHGESVANLDGTFAGWLDVPLTPRGVAQSRAAGYLLRDAGLDIDACFTSVLKRATQSAWHCLDAMERTCLSVERSWRLNERHYGALQGLNKAATAAAYGKEQVRLWRRSYETRPPALSPSDPRAAHDERYADVPPDELPLSESMHDVVQRLRPYCEHILAPQLAKGKPVLVVAHGTTLRAFGVIFAHSSAADAEVEEVPNGVPVVYQLDSKLTAQEVRSLGPRTRSTSNAGLHHGFTS